MSTTYVNVGCGRTPTPGWVNMDNASVTLVARSPFHGLIKPFLPERWRDYLSIMVNQKVLFGNALKLPFPDRSVGVVYSSHMLEHIDPPAADAFLKEALRVLELGGIARIVVPDLRQMIDEYQEKGDADRFIDRTLLAYAGPQDTASKLRRLVRGFREHRWMYDGRSLKSRMEKAGFVNVTILEAGKTLIPNPGALNLYERSEESVYVEGFAPGGAKTVN